MSENIECSVKDFLVIFSVCCKKNGTRIEEIDIDDNKIDIKINNMACKKKGRRK